MLEIGSARISTAATRRSVILGAGGTLFAGAAVAQPPTNLQQITQQLADALAPGKADIWAHWTHPEFVLTDENGSRIERKQFLSDMRPLPSGASGTIRIVDFTVRRAGPTQVSTYVADELEQFHGESLHASYRQTDTWVSTPSGWRLLASQVIALRNDPPAVELPAKLWEEYAGRYQLADGLSLAIVWDEKSATIRKATGVPAPLKAELTDLLFIPSQPRIRYLMERTPDGHVARLRQRRESWDLVWQRIA
jgi:hypothetical protein